ncbi:DUF6161 domain-containing protein [Lysobacter claricitrinus]|uniref:DUF6161 domain-containing protein n=1 Tax=Lysobacter claricitrinus TaxID=3367728 RepID=UPI0037DB93C7
MTPFRSPVTARVYNSDRALTFEAADDVIAWVDSEREFWRQFPVDRIPSVNLRNFWDETRNFLDTLRSFAERYVALDNEQREGQPGEDLRNQMASQVNQIEQGLRLTTYAKSIPALERLWVDAPDVAVMVALSARSDAAGIMGGFGPNISVASLGNALQALSVEQPSEDSAWFASQRQEVQRTVSGLEALRGELIEERDRTAKALTSMREEHDGAMESRSQAAETLLNEIREQWNKLKKVYDEQLAMAAPSQYWSGRANRHAITAGISAFAFAVLVLGSLCAFFYYALPHLSVVSLRKDTSVVLALVPVVVPAFGLIWVTKVVARLLSENLSLMRDAKERETMVKTFLAFAHDEERGKTLLTEQDRILILHALFRPSNIAAVDDSPPVHWFDILSNKMGEKPRT